MDQQNSKQNDLVISLRELPPQNRERDILNICKQREKQFLQLPDFQRDFVWKENQIIGWIKSLIENNAIGVIVTYQLKGGGISYIADGLQRVTATQKFLQNPKQYGFNFGTDQAEQICSEFSITVQHRIYQTHEEAWEAFQRLNQGTTLTPYEFYAGTLKLTPLGRIVVEGVPNIVKVAESRLIRKFQKENREQEHIYKRDAYSLFYQYLTKHTLTTFGDVTSKRVIQDVHVVPIETEILKAIELMTEKELNNALSAFQRFIDDSVIQIKELLEESGGKGYLVGPSVMRWFLHLSIWRRNTGRSVFMYEDFVKKLFAHMLKEHDKITSRLVIRINNKSETVTLTINAINHLLALCRGLNSEFYTGAEYKRKRKSVAPGYNDSHILPFSTTGNGKTFPESAIRNRARGARPIEDTLGDSI